MFISCTSGGIQVVRGISSLFRGKRTCAFYINLLIDGRIILRHFRGNLRDQTAESYVVTQRNLFKEKLSQFMEFIS